MDPCGSRRAHLPSDCSPVASQRAASITVAGPCGNLTRFPITPRDVGTLEMWAARCANPVRASRQHYSARIARARANTLNHMARVYIDHRDNALWIDIRSCAEIYDKTPAARSVRMPRCGDPAGEGTAGRVVSYVHAIAKREAIFRCERRIRNPEQRDVVVSLKLGADLKQAKRARTPVAVRLNPSAWTILIASFEILVVRKFAIALE